MPVIKNGSPWRGGHKDEQSIFNNNKKQDKKFRKETNRKFFCCWLSDLLGIDTKESGYEIVNIADENSIYSPEHESTNKEFGERTGQVYVKSDLIEEMIKECHSRNVC